MSDIPDFSRPDRVNEPKRFTIDGFVYECTGVLPAGATRDLARLARLAPQIEGGKDPRKLMESIELLGDFMDCVMFPVSAKEFADRIRDPQHPIDDEQIGAIVNWLVKEYGGRPTSPPSLSSRGRTNSGTTSTDGD